MWHSAELSDTERDLIADASIDGIVRQLTRRFQDRPAVALATLNSERFSLADLHAGKSIQTKHTTHQCKLCRKAFETSNRLHSHLADVHALERKTNKVVGTGMVTRGKSKRIAQDNQDEPSAEEHKGSTPDTSSPVFTSSATTNVGTGYSFRAWHYISAKVAFGKTSDQLLDICMDSGSSLSIASKPWLLQHYSTLTPCTWAKPVSVGGVGSNRS